MHIKEAHAAIGLVIGDIEHRYTGWHSSAALRADLCERRSGLDLAPVRSTGTDVVGMLGDVYAAALDQCILLRACLERLERDLGKFYGEEIPRMRSLYAEALRGAYELRSIIDAKSAG